MPYALGSKGAIAAIIFGWPLKSPPLPGRNNKILWVPNPGPSGPASPPPQEMTSAVIEASLEGSELRVRRELPGLGPEVTRLELGVTWGVTLGVEVG